MTPLAGLDYYLDTAEVVVAAEVVSVDRTATEADGPLIVEMKALTVPKGRVAVGQTLRTWEAAQVAGTYRVGERRLFLLKRQVPIEPYHRNAVWWNVRGVDLDVFVEEISPEAFTLDALHQWLHELMAVGRLIPSIDIRLRRRNETAFELAVTVANPGAEAIRFIPSRVGASFDTVGRHFMPSIVWNAPATDGWISLEPGAQLSGTIFVDAAPPADMATLPVAIGHLCLSFPSTHAWMGYTYVEVPLQPGAAPAR